MKGIGLVIILEIEVFYSFNKEFIYFDLDSNNTSKKSILL